MFGVVSGKWKTNKKRVEIHFPTLFCNGNAASKPLKIRPESHHNQASDDFALLRLKSSSAIISVIYLVTPVLSS